MSRNSRGCDFCGTATRYQKDLCDGCMSRYKKTDELWRGNGQRKQAETIIGFATKIRRKLEHDIRGAQ